VKVRYHPKVALDAAAIREYGMDRWGHRRTLAFLAGFEETILRLIENPRSGRRREALGEGLRSIRYRMYQVIYRLDGDGLIIVAFLHERADGGGMAFADRLEEL
jgi:plasmid stabilization system protein ParE